MRTLLLLLLLVIFSSHRGQTLYWVGGSGNFNDGQHWSLQSGGKASGQIPTSNSDVVFDNSSGNQQVVITFVGSNRIHSARFQNDVLPLTFAGADHTELHIAGDLVLNHLTSFSCSSKLIFNSSSSRYHDVRLPNLPYSGDVEFRNGNWNLRFLHVANAKSLSLLKGNFRLQNGYVKAGNLYTSNETVRMDVNFGVINIANEVSLGNDTRFTGDRLVMKANTGDPGKYKVPVNQEYGNNAKLLSAALSLPCNATLTSVNVQCSGQCNGSLILSIDPSCGGPTPYNLQWLNNSCQTPSPQFSTTVPGPGTYTIANVCSCPDPFSVVVFDSNFNLLTISNSTTVVGPSAITFFNSNFVQPLCNGQCNGSMNGFLSGGTAPYTVAVTGVIGPSVFAVGFGNTTYTNMCAGTHTFFINDANGCAITRTANLNQPAPVSAGFNITNVACFGQCTGSAVITPTGGTGNYTVVLSPGGTFTLPPGGSTSTTGLCAGTSVSVSVTDNNGCNVTAGPSVITQPATVNITPTQTNVSCFGLCNGAASVQVSGGVAPYTYTWNPGPGSSPGISSLCAGPTTLIVGNNSDMCTNTITFNITQPASVTLNQTVTNVSCFGFCNGSATISPTGGGGPPFTTTWTPAPGGGQGTPTVTGLCALSYTVSVLDNAGCTNSAVVTVTSPPAYTVTALTQSITCFGQCTGAASLSVGGSVPPYTYTWSPAPGAGQGTGTISSLCAGNYAATITSAAPNLCTTTTTISILQPSAMNANVTSASLTCNGVCNGSIGANPSGGNGAPYTYTLIPPVGPTVTSPPPYTNLCSGTYTLRIGDNGNCVQTFTINLAQPNPLVPSISTTSVTCFNSCNGSLSGNVLGGTPGYTLSWNDGTNTIVGPVITNQCAGGFTLTVLDANGCTANATATLTQPTQIQATLNVTPPSCNNGTNGAISAVVAGGTPGYTLTWFPGPVNGNPLTNVGQGNYTLQVTDANNCVRQFTTSVTNPSAIAVSQTVANPACSGACNGSATLVASGGNAPYTYSLASPPQSNTTGIFSGLCPNNYNVLVTAANGCTASATFSISNPPVLSISVNSLVTSCNACTGAGTVTASGGTPTYNIVWTNSLNATVGTGTSATALCPGNLTVSVTDAAGCQVSTTLNIAQTVSVSVLLAGSGIQCFNLCTGSAVATPTGGQAPYTFTWSPPPGGGQGTGTATAMCPNNYTVAVNDVNGCSTTGTINMVNPPAISVTATQTNVACGGTVCTGAISATASGGTGLLSYSWQPSGATTSSIGSLCAGVYTLIVTDANGCTDISTYTITQTPSITFTIAVTNPSNCATNSGSVCVTAGGGGGGPYTFSWSPGGATTSCLNSIGSGVYNFTIFEGGCSTSSAVSITNPSGPTLTINSSSLACFGTNNGGATVTATGTSPFTFTWSPVVSFTNAAASSTASGMTAGLYSVTATDGNSCTTTQTIQITQPASLTVATTAANQLCNPPSPCNGSISVTPSGATPNYTISFLPAGPTFTAGPGATVASTGLCAGNYSANITDENGCVQTRTFALVAPPAISVTSSFSNVTCFGANNGVIAASGSGGTSPLSYSWQPGGAITATITNLGPNVYTLTTTDANSCSITTTVSITQPSSALTSTLDMLNPSCSNSCNASATIVAAGGTPSYNFSWTGGPPPTQTVGGLCAGNYSVTVTDANGCSTVTPFSIIAPAPFTATLQPLNPTCSGSCNAAINTTLTGNQGAITYSWSPPATGPNPTGLCPNTYTLVATDANSCQITAVTSVTNPPALQANVTFTNPSCAASCNGVIASNPLNGNNPISYTWSPGAQNTSSISGQCAGNYTLVITDNNTCTVTQTVTLVAPPALNVNPAITPATCTQSNGAINVGVAGGTPTYNFVWTPPVGSGSVATGLSAGIYTVNVVDANNCANSVAIALSNADGPSVTPVATTSVNCFGQCTGGATVNVGGIQGGTPAYTASWVAPAPSSVNPLSNLCAGNYTAQTTDANGCILFTVATIAEPASLTINPAFTLATCNGNCNGVITLNPSGGTPGYQYTWTPLGPNNSPTLNNACAGNYTVDISDQNACNYSVTVNLPATLNMLAIVSTTNNLCFNTCTAVASVTNVSGGLTPYTYAWSNAQVGPTAFNLCNGTYTVIVTDANNCFNSFTTSVTSPPAITATPAVAAPGCSLCNGSSTVTTGGGIAPYTYSWTSGSSTNIANNLCAGLYQVLITDANNCNIIQNVVVSSSTGITGETFTVQNETCAGLCNGSVSVSPIGGTAPITYSWMAPPSSNSFVTGICSGSVLVQMTDAEGCVRTATTSVSAASDITVSPFITQPNCGSNNGIISIALSGGVPGYTINWAPPAAPPNGTVVSGLGAGIYSVTVTDQGGCSKVQTFNLGNTTAPVITFTQSNVTCFGASTGSISAIGNTTLTPVTYSWSNGATTSTVSGLPAGVITLTVTDVNGCIAIQSFTLTQNPTMLLSISNVVQPRCTDDCNGEITLVPSGGTLPYTFTWSPGSLTGNPQLSLCPGSYTATVIDARGCFTTTSADLVNPPQFTIANTFTNSSCSTVLDGAASASVAGGTGSLSLSWTGPNSFTATGNPLSNLQAGDYTLTVTDSRSCTGTSTLQIVPTITIIANAERDTAFCALNSAVLNGTNSVGASTFAWYASHTGTDVIANTSTVLADPASAGTYTYILETFATPSCRDTDVVIVTVHPLPQVDAGVSHTISMYTSTVIGGNPTSPTGVSFTWTPGFTLDNPSAQNPVASNTVSTVYTVMVADANGCVSSGTVLVEIYPEIVIPNGFSPNNDNKNERWVIDNLDQFPDNEVSVYNRWGELLYFKKGYNGEFDGKFNGKDLPVGTYYYVVVLNHFAYPKPYTGPLTIFR